MSPLLPVSFSRLRKQSEARTTMTIATTTTTTSTAATNTVASVPLCLDRCCVSPPCIDGDVTFLEKTECSPLTQCTPPPPPTSQQCPPALGSTSSPSATTTTMPTHLERIRHLSRPTRAKCPAPQFHRMSYFNKFVLIIFLMCLSFHSEVTCEGIFQLRLDEFVNELNRDARGHCCGRTEHATSNSTSPVVADNCEEKCQIYFRVCFLNYQANIDTNATCHYGENNTHLLHGGHGTGLDYQIDFPFNFSWPGTFSLIIEAWADLSSDAPAHEKRYKKTLVARFPESRGLKLTVGQQWTQRSRQISHNRLQYSYRVLCLDNYYGQHCKTKCTPRNDVFGHYDCGINGEKVCRQGWNGTYCEQAICNACNTSNGDCKGPNYCKCRPGWTGDDCNTCEKYIGCKEGYCNKAYECICKEGWGGLLCNLDLNYCTNHQPCKNGAQCTNTGEGSFTCQCPPGYTGTHCETKVNSCGQMPCLNNATCRSHPTKNYVCECGDSFYGRHCEHQTNPCKKNNPCENGGECSYGPSGLLCSCKVGYSGNKCEVKQKGCAPNPCKHGGNCLLNSTTENEGNYICQCRAGFTGEHCEVNIDDCESNPCLNGGTCNDAVNSFRCQCLPGFVGEFCQVNVDDCLMKPCANGGTCIDSVNDYQCRCPPGYTGKDCSINIDECASSPCHNGGTCHDRVNEYVCTCPPNYMGARCEVAIKQAARTSNQPAMIGFAEADQGFLASTSKILLATVLSIAVPLIILFLVVLYFFCRHWRNHIEKEKLRRHDDEARRQNDHNTIMNTMNNKCFDLNSSAANVIVNALDRPASIHQLNRCHKVTNEYHSFDKSKTLQKGFKLLNTTAAAGGGNNINAKCYNTNLSVKLAMPEDPYHMYEPLKKTDNLRAAYQPVPKKSNLNNYDQVDIYTALHGNIKSDPSSIYTSACVPPSNLHVVDCPAPAPLPPPIASRSHYASVVGAQHRLGGQHQHLQHQQPSQHRATSVYVIGNASPSDLYSTSQSIYDDAKSLHATEV